MWLWRDSLDHNLAGHSLPRFVHFYVRVSYLVIYLFVLGMWGQWHRLWFSSEWQYFLLRVRIVVTPSEIAVTTFVIAVTPIHSNILIAFGQISGCCSNINDFHLTFCGWGSEHSVWIDSCKGKTRRFVSISRSLWHPPPEFLVLESHLEPYKKVFMRFFARR